MFLLYCPRFLKFTHRQQRKRECAHDDVYYYLLLLYYYCTVQYSRAGRVHPVYTTYGTTASVHTQTVMKRC